MGWWSGAGSSAIARSLVWAHCSPVVVAVLGLVVTVLGLGIWGFTQAIGAHVTECRFNAKGAYAKVTVNNLLGGAHEQTVDVSFFDDQDGPDRPYEGTSTYVMVPAHGHATAVLRERFPPRSSQVEGRTVYVLGAASDHPRFVTKQVAQKYPRVSMISGRSGRSGRAA